jgi:tetratricopeptide (TPR) repeat protein
VLLALGRFQKALDNFDRALAIQPRMVDALLGRGRALVGLWRPGEAVPAFDRASSLLPNDSNIWFHRGHCAG